jgi:hypothetical protein
MCLWIGKIEYTYMYSHRDVNRLEAGRDIFTLVSIQTLMLDANSVRILTPKILWNQKLVDCSLGNLYEEKLKKFNFFFWTSELHISQAF